MIALRRNEHWASLDAHSMSIAEPHIATPDAPSASRNRTLPLLLGVSGVVITGLVVALVFALNSSPTSAVPPPPSAFTLRGTLALTPDSVSRGIAHPSSTTCAGKGGYKDLGQGASVTIFDSSSTIIASGQLDAGAFNGDLLDATCTFSFSVPGVPNGHDYYQVEVSHRGKVTLKGDDARAGKASLTIG